MEKIAVDPRCLEDAQRIDRSNFMEVYQESILSVAEIPASSIEDHRAYFFRVMQNCSKRLRSHKEYPTDPDALASLTPSPDYIDPDAHHPDLLLDELLDSPSPNKRDYYSKTLVKETLQIGSVSKAAKQLGINRSSIYHAFRKIREQIETLTNTP